MRSHDEYMEMTVARALNALGAAEDREVNEHLSTCAECRAEFDSLTETASSLAFTAETATPSSDVRTRVLEQARAHSSHVLERQNRPADKIATVIPMRTPMRREWSRGAMLGAIAATLVIAFLVGSLVILWQRNRAMETEVARLSRQVDEAQQELARVREEKGLLNSPDARVASLTGTEMAKDARAMIAYDRATGRAMLVATGLPPAPKGQAYQLWFIPKGKQAMPGGVFATDAAGRGEMRDMVPPEGRDDAVFAVTLERAGGVPAPKGKIYLQGNAS